MLLMHSSKMSVDAQQVSPITNLLSILPIVMIFARLLEMGSMTRSSSCYLNNIQKKMNCMSAIFR